MLELFFGNLLLEYDLSIINMSYQIPWETCRIGWIWSKYTTEIDEYRHFRSTSGKTSDKKFTQTKSIAPNDATWNFKGSPCEQFFDTMTTSQDMDEIVLFGKKLPKKAQLLMSYAA